MEQFTRGNNAHVRVVDKQHVEKNDKPVTGSEADALLRKYYADLQRENPDALINSPFDPPIDDNDDGFRGFAGIEVPKQKPHDPKRDADKNGEYHNTTWGSDGDIDLEITVTSDMPLPKR